MKKTRLAKQKGIVLIFTMLMLMLLTLVTVSMIQQNRQGLAIMSNEQRHIQAFADVEAALQAAEKKIEQLRYTNIDLNMCNATIGESDPNQLDENDVIIEVPETKAMATITGVYCLAGGVESKCEYADGGARRTNAVACDMLYNTGRPFDPPEIPSIPGLRKQLTLTNPVSRSGCPVEVYAITTKIEDDTGTRGQSIIESKYAVNCIGNAG
jgi:Tfp pilus assembly protein PilX